MKTPTLFRSKTTQRGIYGLLVILSIVFMNRNLTSPLYTLANSFTLLSGFYFLYVNFSMTLILIRKRLWKKLLFQNILIFLTCYLISVILYTVYLISLGEGSFQLKYIFMTSYPYRSNFELILFYILGFVFGVIQKKFLFKMIKTAMVVAMICVTCIFVYNNFSSIDSIDDVTVLEEQFHSIEEIIAHPQFRDKTVYVDMWFSSCADCIEQMKNHLPQFKQDMIASNIEMEYLYLGKETNGPMSRKRWWNAIEKYNLKGWHYYIEKEDEKSFWSTIVPVLKKKGKRSYGYPQYLIASNGKIIDYDAPYPEFIEDIKNIILSQPQLK